MTSRIIGTGSYVPAQVVTNEDLANYVAECHKQGIRVILDGVFNHTGRDFFAFEDIKNELSSSIDCQII